MKTYAVIELVVAAPLCLPVKHRRRIDWLQFLLALEELAGDIDKLPPRSCNNPRHLINRVLLRHRRH